MYLIIIVCMYVGSNWIASFLRRRYLTIPKFIYICINQVPPTYVRIIQIWRKFRWRHLLQIIVNHRHNVVYLHNYIHTCSIVTVYSVYTHTLSEYRTWPKMRENRIFSFTRQIFRDVIFVIFVTNWMKSNDAMPRSLSFVLFFSRTTFSLRVSIVIWEDRYKIRLFYFFFSDGN